MVSSMVLCGLLSVPKLVELKPVKTENGLIILGGQECVHRIFIKGEATAFAVGSDPTFGPARPPEVEAVFSNKRGDVLCSFFCSLSSMPGNARYGAAILFTRGNGFDLGDFVAHGLADNGDYLLVVPQGGHGDGSVDPQGFKLVVKGKEFTFTAGEAKLYPNGNVRGSRWVRDEKGDSKRVFFSRLGGKEWITSTK